MEAVVCQTCGSELFRPEGLFLLSSGEVVCPAHMQGAQSQGYHLQQDPLVNLYSQLLATVTAFTQNNSPDLVQWVAPIEQDIKHCSVQWVQRMQSQYCRQSSPWTCANCSFENSPRNPICWQCRQQPGQKAAQPFQGTAPPALVDDVDVNENAWKCPREGCGQMHWKTERSCPCGFQNLNLVDSRIEPEEEEKSTQEVHPDPVPAVPMQYALWVCPCGYEYNVEYMTTCQSCKRAKPESEKREERTNKWKCPQCGRDCVVGTKNCYCGYSSEPQQSYQLPNQKSVSEERKFWTCPSCQYETNIESYTHCSSCNLKRVKETVPVAYDAAMTFQMYPSLPAQSHSGQPEGQVPRQATGGKFETCLRCGYSNPIGEKCTCSVCSQCGHSNRGNACSRCGTPKPPHLCSICQNKADEPGLCKSCAARTGREEPKSIFCFKCSSINCTGVHE